LIVYRKCSDEKREDKLVWRAGDYEEMWIRARYGR